MNTRDTLHANLKHYRTKKGLSQTEVADRIGVSRQAISNWEAKRSYPDLDNIVLLCELYEISTDELLGKGKKEGTNAVEKQKDSLILEMTPNAILETLCLAVILVLTCQFSFLGMLVPIVLAIWLKKTKRNYKLIYVLCIISFLISMQNTYVIVEHTFNLGTPKIKLIE